MCIPQQLIEQTRTDLRNEKYAYNWAKAVIEETFQEMANDGKSEEYLTDLARYFADYAPDVEEMFREHHENEYREQLEHERSERRRVLEG